jgi:hypothetical protein
LVFRGLSEKTTWLQANVVLELAVNVLDVVAPADACNSSPMQSPHSVPFGLLKTLFVVPLGFVSVTDVGLVPKIWRTSAFGVAEVVAVSATEVDATTF